MLDLRISAYHNSCNLEKSQSVPKSSYETGVYIRSFIDFWCVFLIRTVSCPFCGLLFREGNGEELLVSFAVMLGNSESQFKL